MYDVFFFGTAFKMPSQMSPNDGSDGSASDGMASAAKGVGRVRNGCERRCNSGRFRTGRTVPLGLMAGSSVCHSGGSGRARAMAGGVMGEMSASSSSSTVTFGGWRRK